MTENYKIVRTLGHGSFGKVFLVKDSTGREFALKNVSLFEQTKYALNEFQVMKTLNHPQIIKLYDFYPSSTAFNFVMEYAVNGTLCDLIQKYTKNEGVYRLRTVSLLNYFCDIVHGVRYLHSKNIIHRDLKPANILIDKNWRFKLCDFGVSKIIENFPQQHTSIGTLTYMSPEVYLHRPYDKSCDIWSLGLILYEMAFFKHLFNRDEKVRIINYTISFKCPIIKWESRCYDPRFQELLEIMVQRTPNKRASADFICKHNLLYFLFHEHELEAKKFIEENAANRRKSKIF
ncbi:hypothetical protein PVAND_013531 [Polypedilum vanderplanki]|uniref:non-specific serine/threonine protein kinase n=1 Tax=Polypedilum vanderplanki TaxID=319348 RepID=A0A9J6CQR9_POLVA|nr:hypothetical protein PVAND_013531 [Polypedilum vanderplanki]